MTPFLLTDRTNPDVTTGTDAAVFVLNPVKLNIVFTFNPNLKPGYIPNVEEPEFNILFGPQNQNPNIYVCPFRSTTLIESLDTQGFFYC